MDNLTEEQVRGIIRDELSFFLKRDKYVFDKHIQILDGRNIQISASTGLKIGTESTQKIGFLGSSPVSQQSKISDPTGGLTVDSQSRSTINGIIDILERFGFTSSS